MLLQRQRKKRNAYGYSERNSDGGLVFGQNCLPSFSFDDARARETDSDACNNKTPCKCTAHPARNPNACENKLQLCDGHSCFPVVSVLLLCLSS